MLIRMREPLGMGALIRKGALIRRRALNRIITEGNEKMMRELLTGSKNHCMT